MINLNTFQLRLIKFYILPIIFFGLIVSYNFTYTLSKNFIENITINKQIKEIKEIKRKNIMINGTELKKWTLLTESQKDYFLENEKEKLEDNSKFKIKYETKTIKENLNDENIDENYNFFYFLLVLFTNFKLGIILIFLIPFLFLYFFYKKYYLTKLKNLEKFYNLPFYMSNLNSSNNIQNNNRIENIKNMDKFLRYDEKNKEYLFKTNSILQRNLYLNNKEEIEKYLNIENVKIVQDDLIIKISEKSIPKFIKFDENNYQQNFLFLGKSENGKDINLDINGLKHTILIGESGSGKSVFVQSMLLSIFKNLDKYEKIFLVDFKLVEMVRYQNTNEKIDVVREIDDFVELTEKLNLLMFERYKEMKNLNLVNYYGESILVFIDEFRTINNNNLDKKTKEKMTNNLINLLQKSRRRKIFFIFRGQKRDTQNINSSVLSNIMTRITMKTPSNDNLIKIRGTQEELEESDLNHREIRNFNRGRMFYKDGDTGEKFLIQCPFFNVRDDKHRFYMYKLLNLKDDEILRKIKRMKYVDELIIKKNNKLIDKEEFKRLVKEYDLKENNDLNNVLINDNNDIEKIEEIEKNDEEVASFEQEKTEKIEILESNDFNDLEIKDLEIKRLELWKNTNNIEDKKEQSQKRKILFQIKKLIENNEIEEVKKLFKNFK